MNFSEINNNRMIASKEDDSSKSDENDQQQTTQNLFLFQNDTSPVKPRPFFNSNTPVFSQSSTAPPVFGSSFVFPNKSNTQDEGNPFLKYKANKNSGILSYLNGERTPEKPFDHRETFVGEDSPEIKRRRQVLEDAGTKRCLVCDEKFQGRSAAMAKTQHMIIIHFKEKLSADKAEKENGEYKCPVTECGFKSKLDFNWAIHYGTVHGMIRKYEIEFLRDRSKQKEEETEASPSSS